jgi:hypothetical protein
MQRCQLTLITTLIKWRLTNNMESMGNHLSWNISNLGQVIKMPLFLHFHHGWGKSHVAISPSILGPCIWVMAGRWHTEHDTGSHSVWTVPLEDIASEPPQDHPLPVRTHPSVPDAQCFSFCLRGGTEQVCSSSKDSWTHPFPPVAVWARCTWLAHPCVPHRKQAPRWHGHTLKCRHRSARQMKCVDCITSPEDTIVPDSLLKW